MQKRAFSLIELLIVIVIIGVVYTLAIGNFKQIEDGKSSVTLKNLKEFLNSYPHVSSVELLCLDNCSSCDIFIDGEKQSSDGLFDDFIDDTIEVYRYDFKLGMSEIKKKVYFNTQDIEEDVCFSYRVEKKWIGEQVLVKYKERVYDFSSYQGLTPVYDSLQEVKEAKEKLIQEVLN